MDRAIVRYSLNDDASSEIGNKIDGVLRAAQFVKIGTRCWEADGVPLSTILPAISALATLAHNMPGGRTLDHLWIYVDTPEGRTLLPVNGSR